MKHVRLHRFSGARGFTLIESVMVVVVLGFAAAVIVSMQGNMFRGQSDNQDVVTGVQLMQECAELILANRRKSDAAYVGVTTSTCSSLPNFGGYGTPSVTLTLEGDPSPPNPVTACTSASTACTVTITVAKGGASLSPITLRLVRYQY